MQTISFTEFKKKYDVNFKAKEGDGDFIGFGGFGEVYKGYDKLKHVEVAIKKSPTKNNLLKEVEMATLMPSNANIARYLTGYRVETEADDFDVSILQFYPLGNLNQLMRVESLSYDQIIEILKGILHGLDFLHSGFIVGGEKKKIIHRDLKPRNILITKYNGHYIPLITDFGVSKLVHEEEIHSTGGVDLSSQLGTVNYKAPEQVLGTKSVRSNLDLWAFGIITFEMITGKTPFSNTSQLSTNAILKQITEGDLNFVFQQIENKPQVFQQIIKACLVRDTKQRVQKAIDVLKILNEGEFKKDFTVKSQKIETVEFDEKTDVHRSSIHQAKTGESYSQDFGGKAIKNKLGSKIGEVFKNIILFILDVNYLSISGLLQIVGPVWLFIYGISYLSVQETIKLCSFFLNVELTPADVNSPYVSTSVFLWLPILNLGSIILNSLCLFENLKFTKKFFFKLFRLIFTAISLVLLITWIFLVIFKSN